MRYSWKNKPSTYAVFLASKLYKVKVWDDRAMRFQIAREQAGRSGEMVEV